MAAPELRGARVLLRPWRESDVAARARHGWHAEIERGYGDARATGPMTDEEARSFWDVEYAEGGSDTHWVVDLDGEPVGVTFLGHVRPLERSARFAIGFYSPDLLGRGLGTETTRLVLDHAFGPLGLHRVDLLVLAFNERAIAMYTRCGFVLEGRMRESCPIDGVWCDDLLMSVLEQDHRARPPL